MIEKKEGYPIYKDNTRINKDMYDEALPIILKRGKVLSIVSGVILIVYSINIFISDLTIDFTAALVIFILTFIVSLHFGVKKKTSEALKDDLLYYPNKIFTYEFYEKYLYINILSDNSSSSIKIPYNKFKVRESKNYYLLTYRNSLYPIKKDIPKDAQRRIINGTDQVIF